MLETRSLCGSITSGPITPDDVASLAKTQHDILEIFVSYLRVD